MRKLRTLTTVYDTGTVLIVRLPTAEASYEVAREAVAGGIRAVEVTLTTPGALDVIRRLNAECPEAEVGAGSVLDAESAYASIQAGARFLVSPHVDRGMLETAGRYQVVSICGAATPTEIVQAASAGADMVKLFPSSFLNRDYARAVLEPLAHIPLVPAGGVSPGNLSDWFDAGVTAVGVGSFITKAARRETTEQYPVRAAARTFLQAVADARA
ncbi:bifunctional 4-hydroxy-2-oxoglutarate aldolase/2-dehydro-3-deoxy-phosphogluconate aldolase [Amycolatopsis sp. FDAARGOS 1241]|uniref:bifunctional 4-hydroxy-2-oxoglutarate aldolase/2-dehydro-3-deoxy-phosphogluconate aldolase n=1 Tax=Amycolatopsis sp. FDAARGOS 1241 TaxID=2778070 RepID=UPI00194DC07C|nr:bifunctional 4-hydroxy-2-oxoglutarate aldolase/2-dehydro-3-deoxy-phosphogluconate aldolase [Amycolatopsis sp. FDAARGOS 1241]QRP46024.1 bifunctional 4-hydroxy-2-oxoglutarate aldolase/2-dehydro-3-deoxy-phosphogluconate aldolase [Amycolatopsis sp. FDAARGOS 1241]